MSRIFVTGSADGLGKIAANILTAQGQMDIQAFREGQFNYSETKLHMVLLAKAIARKWHGVYANAVNPGWVPTKMGGAGAPTHTSMHPPDFCRQHYRIED